MRYDPPMTNITHTQRLTHVANGPMRTKEEIQDVTRAALKMAETDLDYLRDDPPGDDRHREIIKRVAARLDVQAARLRLAMGYGGEE